MQPPPSQPLQPQYPSPYGQPQQVPSQPLQSQPLPPYGQPQWGQQQPPQMPPQMPPAPRRRSRRGLWIALGVILLVLVVCSAAASQLKGTSTAPNTNTQSTQPAHQQATQPVATPTQAQAQGNVIGKPVQINDTWTVTLNSVSTSKGTDFNKPKSGNIFLVVNVTLKNTSTQNQTASSLTMFSLKDGTGQTYDQNVFQGKSPDGTVAAGGVIRGDIAYEVPTSIHNFTLQCTPSLGTNDLAEWAVKI